MDEAYGSTQIHPVALLLTISMGVAMFVVRRDRTAIPLLIVACFITHAQRVVIGGLDFSMLRILVLFGWARVLFDGQEVWRGDTSEIWAYQGRNGGYIEVSDFEPGLHTLRAESMGFDYHPVTVAFFGFNHEGAVKMDE